MTVRNGNGAQFLSSTQNMTTTNQRIHSMHGGRVQLSNVACLMNTTEKIHSG